MDEAIRRQIVDILEANRVMSVATLRPDGWPQATTVGYAHEGLTLYFLCGPDSQKANNIARDSRVSLTINPDSTQIMEITGLSMAARAEMVSNRAEKERVMGLLMARYPEQANLPGPMPDPDQITIVRLVPQVVSVLDYSKGFGHTDLVTC
jgi:nitroimidazol reductase NimA-like FMN-containing flavoprotein (pyridoxamine 5'-phosphate oxidase superfamily)